MRSTVSVSLLLAAAFSFTSCSRDPNVVKQRYLESGDKYYAMGKYNEARIRYRNALAKDMRFGKAYYKLGLTEIKREKFSDAVAAFRRALDLDNTPAVKREIRVKLSDIYLAAGNGDKRLLDEVDGLIKELAKEEPDSFDVHRLNGDLAFARAVLALKVANRDQASTLIDTAVDEYKKADKLKPGQPKVVLQLARSVGAKGQYADAEKYLKQVIELDKTERFAYGELYTLYMVQNRIDDAQNVLKLAFQNNPKEYKYLRLLAEHYSRQKRLDDMRAVLQQIKAGYKDYPDAYIEVGSFYLRVGDGESAVREFKEGITKDPNRKHTYQKAIIEVLMRQGKREEAAELNSQILKEDPKDPEARGLAATFLMDKGDLTHALTELQSAVTRAPDNAVLRYQLGRANAAHGDWEQARQSFQKAIELRGDYLLARLALAQLQVTRGEYDAALKSVEQILTYDPNSLSGRMIQAAAMLGQKRFTESKALLQSMAKASPNSSEVYFQMGVAGLMENKYKDAEDAFKKAWQLNPANPRGLFGVVQSYLGQNEPDQALTALRTEVDKQPNRLDLRELLANTEVLTGKFDAAVADYQKVMDAVDKNSKERAQLYFRIGETYRRKGDNANAIANLQKAREAMPENPDLLTHLGLAFDQAGRWNEAKQVYEASIKINSNNGPALNNLAFILAEHGGDLDDALSKAQRAKQLMPNLAEVSDTLGWIYVKKQQSDAAIDILKDLVTRVPNNATFRYHLAMAFNNKGDRSKAVKELQEALKNNPTKEEKAKIQEALGRLQGSMAAAM